MPTTKPSLAEFTAAVIDYVRANPAETVEDAIAAILPDYLSWDATGWHSATRAARCGGGDPPESAGFDSFELDRAQTPAWAVEVFDGLSDAQQIEITLSAEDAEIDRRD